MNHLFDKVFADRRADEAREAGIYPYFHRLESRQDAVVVMESKRRIMLGSNNYLGLTSCPEVMEAAIKAIEKYGTGCSGSRFLNGNLDLHLELERELAGFIGKGGRDHIWNGFPDEPRRDQRARGTPRLPDLRCGRPCERLLRRADELWQDAALSPQ